MVSFGMKDLLTLPITIVTGVYTALKFIYHCFLRPLQSGNSQKTRLDQFYEGQAGIYDATRGGLLRGRHTMLALSASHLRILRETAANKRLVWVDIGGGTGHNIEFMDDHFPVSSFDAIYIVDICEPLLQVARDRIAKRGWKNVTVLCQDATVFWLPEWLDGIDPRGSVSFVTMSYSITMIPRFHAVLDRVEHVLAHETGLFGVADFYTAEKQESLIDRSIGGLDKGCGWFRRWFWRIFFEFDHIFLGSARRSYLEHRFGTIKSLNGRNHFLVPYLVQIPYYIWLGRSRFRDNYPLDRSLELEYVSQESPGIPVEDVPLTPFHYSITKHWRVPYFLEPTHEKFHSFTRVFTPEDSMELIRHLEVSRDDSVLFVTSAGDSALHLAINSRPKQIHCVDPNPIQGHLLELKLAAIQSLEYEDFFALFGEGKHPTFRSLLDSRIAPYLSAAAYQFWKRDKNNFSSSFYLDGSAGQALAFMRSIFGVAGLSKDVIAFCNSDTLVEQQPIWQRKIRPVMCPTIAFLLRFGWRVFGIPPNQWKMLLKDGDVSAYVRDTLDPLISKYLLKTESHFFHLALTGHYTPQCCPEYLTRAGFERLRTNKGEATDAIRLHTKSMLSALRSLPASSLTHIVLMDHFDSSETREVDDEIAEIHRVLNQDGSVLWQSVVRTPWYNNKFELRGFEVTTLYMRNDSHEPMDRVNIYASFYKATKSPTFVP